MITTGRTPIAAGSGYQYLTRSVAAGDGDLGAADRLLRYYEAHGTPPGRWLGSGLRELGEAGLAPESQVSEEQMGHLFGMGRDPLDGQLLGTTPRVLKPLQERIAEAVANLDPNLTGPDREAAVAAIRTREQARATTASRMGFDLTFTVPKSVSAMWAVADAGVQAQIVAAHHEAISETLALMEREVIKTRIGAAGVAQIDTRGLIAAAFDHFDSREGDPHLHTHVVVANRVQGADGKWRTLDSKALYRAVVAMSRTHDALLADRLAGRLPVAWQRQYAGARKVAKLEIGGVPDQLVREFSGRDTAIRAEQERLQERFAATHGRHPSPRESRGLHQRAWAHTRANKDAASLAALTSRWRDRAVGVLARLGLTESHQGEAAAWWVRSALQQGEQQAGAAPTLRTDDLDETAVVSIATRVLTAVQERRSTWSRWNLHSEVALALSDYRFASATDLERAIDAVVDHASNASVTVSTPALAHTPTVLRRADGTSVFDHAHSTLYTSEAALAAEDYLLTRSSTVDAARVDLETAVAAIATYNPGRPLSEDQATAVTAITTSGRNLDLLVGPAGAGKTTTLAALRTVWEETNGLGSVVGLAPSSAAASVLANELGITADNTAKWLTEHGRLPQRRARLAELTTRRDQQHTPELEHLIAAEKEAIGRWTLRSGQLVIVDEASLAGTFALQRLATAAEDAGAKLLLVGDPHQLAAVEAGGAFGMLVADMGADTPQLRTVHRFRAAWEAAATLGLRTGRPSVLDTYESHDRISSGTDEEILEGAYAAWLADTSAGHSSLLIATDNDTVRSLNVRAQADLIAAGAVQPGVVDLADDTRAGTGDTIVTRRNDRRLATSSSAWVKNGDRWRVLDARTDGSLVVQRERGGSHIVLPGNYVAEHVELAYAATTYRAQGSTVDRAHAVITESTTREALYVNATRGRHSNRLWVSTRNSEDHTTPTDQNPTAREILERVLANTRTEKSAHESFREEQEAAGSIPTLVNEYELIISEATRDRWSRLLQKSPLTSNQVEDVQTSPSWGALQAALRRASATSLPIERFFPTLVNAQALDDADDVAAVLHHRVETWAQVATPSHRTPALIAGLIPQGTRSGDPDLDHAMAEREQMITARATAVLQRAIANDEPWTRPPTTLTPYTEQQWRQTLLPVAAYRDLHGIHTDHPLGPAPETDFDRHTQYQRARAAIRHVRHIAEPASAIASGQPTTRADTEYGL
ncbi:MobF family relaxase [Ruania zhangjianzhongii]|uniref:MobF family relaxase n=1 Tax=Ruania zhangjianzhongii TaxID=2603206 RepID=UPI001652698F|nr:MobF family relaxase [Ruania zhangjianzhongii]